MFSRFQFLKRTALLVLPVFLLNSCAERLSDNDWQKEHELKESMTRIQVGVEHFAADHGGEQYPTELDDEFKSYLPGGVEGSQPAIFGPINPFSGKNEFPTVKTLVKDLHTARFGERIKLKPGEILYCPLDNGKGYAILAGGFDGNAMLDDKNPGQVLVLSNYED